MVQDLKTQFPVLVFEIHVLSIWTHFLVLVFEFYALSIQMFNEDLSTI